MSDLRERYRRAVREHLLNRVQGQCVEWRTATGERMFGVVVSVNRIDEIARVTTQKWGTQFVRVARLQPYWGAW